MARLLGLRGLAAFLLLAAALGAAGEGSLEDGDAEELREERAYFASLDLNHDGGIDLAEFEEHMKHIADIELDEERIDNMYKNNLTLGMTVGKVWLEMHGGDSTKEAFGGVDTDRDGMITWGEWEEELFHDEPQQPEYLDGQLDDAMDEKTFREFDADGDGSLGLEEVRKVAERFMRREEVDPVYAGTVDETRHGSTGVTYLFLMEFDINGDSKISLEEWTKGFAKKAEGPPPDSILVTG